MTYISKVWEVNAETQGPGIHRLDQIIMCLHVERLSLYVNFFQPCLLNLLYFLETIVFIFIAILYKITIISNLLNKNSC